MTDRQRSNLADFFRDSPLAGSELALERDRSPERASADLSRGADEKAQIGEQKQPPRPSCSQK
jgi:hypothetical protein